MFNLPAFAFLILAWLAGPVVVFVVSRAGSIARKAKSIATPGNNSPNIDEDLLHYFKEGDFIRDVSKYTENPDTAPVMYTFLGVVEEEGETLAVVFDGEPDNPEEAVSKQPHMVKKLTLPQLFAYTNVQAEVRRKQMEGARTYCDLKNSRAEEKRQYQYERKTSFEEMEALPCDLVERTKARIENEPMLTE